MNWLVCHIVSGHSFFTGVALMLAGLLLSTRPQPVLRRVSVLCVILGAIAAAVSSAAISYWYYGAAAAATTAWIVSRFRKTWARWAPYIAAAAWLVAGAAELPSHFAPSLDPVPARSLAVVGDSVSAGIGDDETAETWPRLLAREHRLRVQDLSHIGETAEFALKRARKTTVDAPLVVVEIGGNDLFGQTTAAQFGRDLDALLAHLTAPGRQIVMFELPLPPFCHEYGRAQRRISAKHGVKLIPKRFFVSVIAGEQATLDSIHLSQSGHQAMADCVWRLIGPAFAPARPLAAKGWPA